MPDAMAVNPVAALFPMLPDDELAELAADIRERGQLQPIVLDGEGRILDGRNRHAACEMADVEPRFETYEGDDPDGYALAVNIARRHLTNGARAVIAARAARLNGTKGTSSQDQQTYRSVSLNIQRVAEANVILDFAPDLADSVVAGARPLTTALEAARERKKEAADLKAKMDRLTRDAPDLRALVDEERMSVDDAIAALSARQETERREADAQAAAEMMARQEALTAWGQACDAILSALSYAKVSTPPADTDNYPSVSKFMERLAKLTEITDTWENR